MEVGINCTVTFKGKLVKIEQMKDMSVNYTVINNNTNEMAIVSGSNVQTDSGIESVKKN